MPAVLRKKATLFYAELQQGRRNNLPSNNYLKSATFVVLTLVTQHHHGKTTSKKAIMRKASPVNIKLKCISTIPTNVANDDFLPDVLVRNALVSDQMDQRSSSSQTQRTTKNRLSNNYLLSIVSVLFTMPISFANHAFLLVNIFYIC